MQSFSEAFFEALNLIIAFDGDLREIILLSLQVSVSAVLIASIVGLPAGAWLATTQSALRPFILTIVSALMGLPPVVVGLVVYLLLSNARGLGTFAAAIYTDGDDYCAIDTHYSHHYRVTRETLFGLYQNYKEQLSLFGVGSLALVKTLLWEGRHGLMTALLAGFGRAIAEVGAVIIVGGNINHVTRVMTTTIALETSKGNLSLALGLGIVLVLIALFVNAAVLMLGNYSRQSEWRS